MFQTNRRNMLATTGAAITAATLGHRRQILAAAQTNLIETKVISHQANSYCGWPTIVRRKNGQLLVVYSGGRVAHVCPFGRVELICSRDDGDTWSWPRVLLDAGIDDRDAGILETNQGTLLVTTFTSVDYSEKQWWPQPDQKARYRKWQAAHNRLTEPQRQQSLGVWMTRSTDQGVTWSGRYDSLINSPHGPIQLSDGRQLYVGKDLWRNQGRIGVCESTDDGQTWNWLAGIPTRDQDDHQQYHELHAVETNSGTIVAQIRNHNKNHALESLQTESHDGGKTWSVPHSIGVFGYPSHLLKLTDGRLLMTYGHRRPPYGNQARISEDHGHTWSEPMIISGDAVGRDMGYPSTVELPENTLLSVWYEVMQDSPFAVLRQAKWKLA